MKPPEASPQNPKVRVLIADSQETIASTLATILDLAGYDICALYMGDTAHRFLDLLKPDLIITDITAAATRATEGTWASLVSLPPCKILLFTGAFDLHDLLREEGCSDLAFELIISPISPGHLLERIGQGLCSENPPLLMPISTDDGRIH